MRRRVGLPLVACLAVMILAGSIAAWRVSEAQSRTEVRRLVLAGMTKEELAAASSLIVEGVVEQVLPARWNTVDGQEPSDFSTGAYTIYHDVGIRVDEVLKGSGLSGKIIQVRVFTGHVPSGKSVRTVVCSEEPVYSKDERVLAFLSSDSTMYNLNNETDHYITTGAMQGKYLISGDTASTRSDKSALQDLRSIVERHRNDPLPGYMRPSSP